jgi:hypothetical protein
VTLQVEYNPEPRSVTLSGTLTNGFFGNGNKTIVLGGQVGGSTTTNGLGQFEITLTATGLGYVTARTADYTSNLASYQLTDGVVEFVDFDAIEGMGGIWTFRGHVEYNRPFDSLTIFFGGSPVSLSGKVTQTDETGYFEYFVQLNGYNTDNGWASARAMTWWGTYSDEAIDLVQQTP